MIALMMQRLMIQAEPELVERAKRRARERGVSVAQIVREAMEHELGVDDEELVWRYLFGDLANVGDAEAGVEQDGSVRPFDEP